MRLKLLLISIIFLVAAVSFSFLEKNQLHDIDHLIDDTSHSIQRAYTSSFKSYKLAAQKEHYNLLNNEAAMDILKKFKKAPLDEKQILRGELYRFFAKHYDYLKTLNVRQFHFHTHKGESLMRFHVPHSNGDGLIDIRHSIKVANTLFEPVFGFEGGKIYPGFRYLFPIIKDDEHLGSIEYSISFEGIEKLMKETFPEHTYHLLLDESISYKKVFKWHRNYFEPSVFGKSHYVENKNLSPVTNKIVEDPIIKELNQQVLTSTGFGDKFLEKEEFSIPVVLSAKGYIVSFHSIKDTLGKHAAYLVSYTKNNGLIEINEKYEIFRLVLFLGLLLVFVLTYVVINQFEKIFIQNKKLEKINIGQLEKITEQSNELETIFNTTKDGIAIVDLQTNFLLVNKAYENLTGFSKKELLNKSCISLTDLKDTFIVKESLKEVMQKGYMENLEKTCIIKDGKKVQVNLSIALLPDKKRLLLSAKDITEKKRREKVINDYISLIDKHIITSSTDLQGVITDVSEAFCKISGYDEYELVGKKHNIIRHPDMPALAFEDMWSTITSGRTWKGEVKNLKKDGGYYWVDASVSPIYSEDNKIIGYTSIRQDITDRKRVEEISITDALTNIYNRRYFNEIFPKVINTAKRKNELVCFIIMDVDHFKLYNDTYGHQMGDKVLTSVAKAIKDSLKRANDYCFRLGGEEFGVVFHVENEKQSKMFANKIRSNIEELAIEHQKNGDKRVVTVSMGLICKNAKDILDDDQVYKEADELLYMAKRGGRNCVVSNID